MILTYSFIFFFFFFEYSVYAVLNLEGMWPTVFHQVFRSKFCKGNRNLEIFSSYLSSSPEDFVLLWPIHSHCLNGLKTRDNQLYYPDMALSSRSSFQPWLASLCTCRDGGEQSLEVRCSSSVAFLAALGRVGLEQHRKCSAGARHGRQN